MIVTILARGGIALALGTMILLTAFIATARIAQLLIDW